MQSNREESPQQSLARLRKQITDHHAWIKPGSPASQLKASYKYLASLATQLDKFERGIKRDKITGINPTAKLDYMRELGLPMERFGKLSASTISSITYGSLNEISEILKDARVHHLAKPTHFKLSPKEVRSLVVPKLLALKSKRGEW